jgi:hypothetical protein
MGNVGRTVPDQPRPPFQPYQGVLSLVLGSSLTSLDDDSAAHSLRERCIDQWSNHTSVSPLYGYRVDTQSLPEAPTTDPFI